MRTVHHFAGTRNSVRSHKPMHDHSEPWGGPCQALLDRRNGPHSAKSHCRHTPSWRDCTGSRKYRIHKNQRNQGFARLDNQPGALVTLVSLS
jgi:hypothetical protein